LGDIENPVLGRRAVQSAWVFFSTTNCLVHDPSAQGSWPRTTNPMARHAPHTTVESSWNETCQEQFAYLLLLTTTYIHAPNY
jgi:hypothetical protein